VAAAVAGLVEVQHLAQAGQRTSKPSAAGGLGHHGMIGIGSTPVSAIRPANTEVPGRLGLALDRAGDLFEGQRGGDIQLHAVARRALDQRQAAFRRRCW
jgi:hypothetical protein